MKTKKIKRRSFVSAIALLVISAITLTTSTFAWFSMGKEAKIETMELTVSSPDGFQISANALEWTSVLTPEEIFKMGEADIYTAKDDAVNYLPLELRPVSCAFAGNTDFYNANFASATTTGPIEQSVPGTYVTEKPEGYAESVTHNAEADKAGFVAFDLYIKSGYAGDAVKLYFNQSEFKYDETRGEEDLHALASLRVAFVNKDTNEAVVYEPDSLTRRGTGEWTTGGSHETTYYVTGAGSNLERGTSGKTFSSSNSVIAESSARVIYSDNDADQQYIEIKNGVNNFRVFIWVEGNDAECIDEIGSDKLAATFRFLDAPDATPEIP